MKLLFIGDIVGRPGRGAVEKILPGLKRELKCELVFANGENLAHGRGMNISSYEAMLAAGVDYFTSGNHIWDNREFVTLLDDEGIRVLRPANYPKAAPGRGLVELEVKGGKIALLNLQGRVFMPEALDNPFHVAEEIIARLRDVKMIIVDFHAEATSEKNCLGYALDGKVSAVLGTHTHVPTADERILPGGTAYISDLGMTGPIHSSIGAAVEPIIEHFKTGLPWRYEVAEGPVVFNALYLELDEKTGKATAVKRIQKFID